MLQFKPSVKQSLLSFMAELLIVMLLLLQNTYPEFHWIYIIVYMPILFIINFIIILSIKRLPIIHISEIIILRILPFFVLLFKLNIIYGFVCIIISECISFIRAKYYNFLVSTFPRKVGRKLNIYEIRPGILHGL